MNWIAHLDTMAIILVSADVASVCISAVFFSERIRRWTNRKRWGSLPSAISHIDSLALAGMEDLAGGSIPLQPVTFLRNPFEPRTREALAGGTPARPHRQQFPRPTFRRSTVLQQRIALYERALGGLAMGSPAPWEQARPPILPTTGGLLNPRFEGFNIGQFQEAQLS